MKNLIQILILSALFLLVSCGSPNKAEQIPSSQLTDKQQTFLKELYKNNGKNNGPSYTSRPIIVKINTVQGGQWIVVKEFTRSDAGLFSSPDYGYYVAYDLASYEPGQFQSYLDFSPGRSIYGARVDTDYAIYLGTYSVGDNTFNNYYSYDLDTGEENIITFEENSGFRKDLEKIGANLESLDNQDLSLNLEENYGLSEERAQSVAKITSSFQKIQNKRALTAKEMNIYTQKVLGVDYTAGKKALESHIQGDSSEMDELMERAADLNGTSPEAVQELMGEYLLK